MATTKYLTTNKSEFVTLINSESRIYLLIEFFTMARLRRAAEPWLYCQQLFLVSVLPHTLNDTMWRIHSVYNPLAVKILKVRKTWT